MKHIIVGIDPGKTAAIACLDLEGKIVLVDNFRFAGFSWFVKKIRQAGIPVIIASDKKIAPHLVEKISAAFGALIFSPESDITVKKKEEMSKSLDFANLHERDALVSALNAYNAYSAKFMQAEKLARLTNYQDIDKLKAMVVQKYSMHETITNKKAGKRA